MGRPIQNKVFGDLAAPGLQFAITAKVPGEAVGEGYIVEQQGTSKYRVNINGTEGVVFLVNTLTPANLNDGEAFVAVTPFGGSTVAASKIMQRKVNVFNIVDSPFSSFSSYKWSDLPAAATGEADVGVSVAGSTSNILGDTSMFIFEQEDPQNSPTPYITTFRAFGWSSSARPGGGQHVTFATSDNKVVIFHEGDFTNGVVDGGAVTVMDGTTAGVPTVIGGSAITSTWESGEIDEYRPQVIQLTDTRYARIGTIDTTGPTNSQRLEIIDVNLTTGAASIDLTHDLEQYFTANRQAANNGNILIQKITNTRIAVMFSDSGVSTTTTVDGALFAMIFNDNGASISVQMPKTLMIDMTAPANNGGDVLADIGRLSGWYLGSTNKALVAVYETERTAARDVCMVACEINATDSDFDTNGALHVWLDAATYVQGFSPRIRRISDTHFIVMDEDRRVGKDSPYIASIGEVNTSTYAITTGTPTTVGLVGAGSLDNVRIDNDFDVWVDSTTKAYMHTNWESGDEEIAANTRTINAVAFDGTQDLDGADRIVDTASNLTTDWPGQNIGVRVLAADTGFVHRYNGATWDLLTLNSVRWDYRGQAMIELTLDVGAKTITTTKQQMFSGNHLPRFESDGAGGVQYTGQHTGFEVDSASITKLPNGKFVISCEGVQSIAPNGPFFNATDYAAIDTDWIGGDFVMQYFDPTLMP
jgi:hypothetical protein